MDFYTCLFYFLNGIICLWYYWYSYVYAKGYILSVSKFILRILPFFVLQLVQCVFFMVCCFDDVSMLISRHDRPLKSASDNFFSCLAFPLGVVSELSCFQCSGWCFQKVCNLPIQASRTFVSLHGTATLSLELFMLLLLLCEFSDPAKLMVSDPAFSIIE